jgi:hypothetical protein
VRAGWLGGCTIARGEMGGTQLSHGGAAGNADGYPSSEGVCSSRRRCDRPVERGMSKREAAHKQAFVAQPPSQRISFQRTTRPRREPREHAVVSVLIRWYLHSPLLIPARPPRCSAMRTASHSNKSHYTRLHRPCWETRNFEILGDWVLNSSRNDHQGITSTITWVSTETRSYGIA